MKKLHYILGLSLLLPAFAFAPVLAESSSSGSGSGTEDKTTTTVTANDSTTVQTTVSTTNNDDASGSGKKIGEPSTDATEMKTRLEHLKTGLKIKLDAATKKRIELKCKPAQSIVQGAEKNDKANGTKREEIYNKISTSVQSLIDRLKANSVDTTALAAAEATLEQKIAAFNTDMTTYQQDISDLKLLDCTADPAAFQAALQAARTDREKVRTDAVDIRTFITTTLKPALEAVKGELKPAEDKTTTSGGTN